MAHAKVALCRSRRFDFAVPWVFRLRGGRLRRLHAQGCMTHRVSTRMLGGVAGLVCGLKHLRQRPVRQVNLDHADARRDPQRGVRLADTVDQGSGAAGGGDVAPLVLDTYANTAPAGSVLAFHEHRADLQPGDVGVICSFGAGYSIGSVIVRRK